MEMLGGEDSAKKSRNYFFINSKKHNILKLGTPQIMADAAYSILCQPTSFSGNFCIDDEHLEKYHNITDFRVNLQ